MSLIEPLRALAPFDEMEPEALQFLERRLSVAYYARGEVITDPERGVADRLYIVKQGRVQCDAVLGPGEFFPVGALVGRRATTNVYRAQADTFCWELRGAEFHALLEMSAVFRAFCTDHLAMLLARSQKRLRAEAGEALIERAGMLAPLRSVLRRPAVSCARETPVREVLATMRRERVGSMVVVDAALQPLGIFTTQDVLERVAAPQADVSAAIGTMMTPAPFTLEEGATLAEAALAMARRRIRHVVVTRDGRLAGVVSERDLFALQRVGVLRTAESVAAATSLAQLVAAAADIRRLTSHLLAQGVAAEALTAMASALNDALTQRAIELAAARRQLSGSWCWLALGSEGRMEQTFITDQDNALIYIGGNGGGSKAELLELADEVNRALDACGFPLCKGDIMARNPRWCLTAQEWRRLFDDWIRNTDPEALLGASVFFDLRPLAGEARLAGDLREAVLAQAAANRAFLRAMADTALRARPPLGLIGDFSDDQIDLKALGARPFVDAARVLGLAAGSPETGTAARLRAAGEKTAVEAFHYIQMLRLRNEGNVIRVKGLNEIDRRVLKEAFRQAVALQSRLRLDHQL
jgi:CBS domain-containing protein